MLAPLGWAKFARAIKFAPDKQKRKERRRDTALWEVSLWRLREFVMTVGYDEFVEIFNKSEETTMKALFEQSGGIYHKQGDYSIPNLSLSENEENNIGIYGWRQQAQERFGLPVAQMKDAQDITEGLKVYNPIEWVGRMNCIRQQAEEIILKELNFN